MLSATKAAQAGIHNKESIIKQVCHDTCSSNRIDCGSCGVVAAQTAGETAAASQLEVRFGDNGAAYTMTLKDNDTAAAIKKHVGTADWRLPICHYDDCDN